MLSRRLSIIVPSYNDPRIVRAIRSIRRFDDIGTVRIVVIDGGSSQTIKLLIEGLLTKDDILVSEPDRGIFDALNKGLDLCETEFIGYLGSDDLYTGEVLASQVVEALCSCDVLITDVEFFRRGYVTRKTHALPSRLGFMNLGLHNPHFATFGTAALLRSERFTIGLRGSDIEYFIKIFNKKPRVKTLNVVGTFQEEGGFSNKSVVGIIRTNFELIPIYARHTNWFLGPVAVSLKLGYKLLSRLYYKALPARLPAGVDSILSE